MKYHKDCCGECKVVQGLEWDEDRGYYCFKCKQIVGERDTY